MTRAVVVLLVMAFPAMAGAANCETAATVVSVQIFDVRGSANQRRHAWMIGLPRRHCACP
jgi:hypothetical protein